MDLEVFLFCRPRLHLVAAQRTDTAPADCPPPTLAHPGNESQTPGWRSPCGQEPLWECWDLTLNSVPR